MLDIADSRDIIQTSDSQTLNIPGAYHSPHEHAIFIDLQTNNQQHYKIEWKEEEKEEDEIARGQVIRVKSIKIEINFSCFFLL